MILQVNNQVLSFMYRDKIITFLRILLHTKLPDLHPINSIVLIYYKAKLTNGSSTVVYYGPNKTGLYIAHLPTLNGEINPQE